MTAKSVLGGRWSASPAIWLVLFGPASLLVILQETLTPFGPWWALPVSALAQHAVGGLVIVGLISILRRFYALVPAEAAIAVWVVGGIARGLVSAWFVDGLSWADPQYGLRALTWGVVSLVWMPLAVYTAAQLDLRASLMSSIITLRMDIEVEHAEADISERVREGRLLSAVATAIAPVIVEIRQSIVTALSESKRPLATVSDKIESVVDNVLDIIIHEPIGAPPRSRVPRRLMAPLSAALNFDSSRPVFAAALVTVASASLLVPESLRFGGAKEAFDAASSIAVAGVVTAVLLILLKRMSKRARARVWHVALVLVIAALVGSGTFLLTCEYPLYAIDVSRAFAIPVSILGSAFVLSSAVGLSFANLDVLPEEKLLEAELTELRALAAEREEATREQFSSLMHGPVLGRLSACVMALNFHAAGGGGTAASRAVVAEQVLAHLDLVAADLEQMTGPREFS